MSVENLNIPVKGEPKKKKVYTYFVAYVYTTKNKAWGNGNTVVQSNSNWFDKSLNNACCKDFGKIQCKSEGWESCTAINFIELK